MTRIEKTSMNTIILQLLKRLTRVWVLVVAALLAPLASADDDFQILSSQGVIETIDVPANQVVVGGVRYSVAADANVEIGGSYGAFTLLQPGMNVEILVRRYVGNGKQDIIDLKELAPGVKPRQY
jgi:hypothetical protein